MSANFKIDVLHNAVTTNVPAGQSTDIARKGDTITCTAVDAANTYSWSLVFTPDFSNGDPSAAALINPPGSQTNLCKFIVDAEGAYMVRLVVDAGLPTEDTMFLRVRYETVFGDVKLVSAGERRDQTAVIPADIDPVGWSDDQNQNLQKILAYVRRLSTSGRVLYVDANRGRTYEASQATNDPANIVYIPGDDPANLEQTGVFTGAEGFGDFSTIQGAIDYADAAGQGSRAHEPQPDSGNPFFIVIKPGLYVEDLNLKDGIYLLGDHDINSGGTWGVTGHSVAIQGNHSWNDQSGGSPQVFLKGLIFKTDSAAANASSVLTVTGAAGGTQDLYIDNCLITQEDQTGGHVLHLTGAGSVGLICTDSRVQSRSNDITKWAIYSDPLEGAAFWFDRLRILGLGQASGVRLNASLAINSSANIRDCRFETLSVDAGAYTLHSDTSSLYVSDSLFKGRILNQVFAIHPTGAAFPTFMNVSMRDCFIANPLDTHLGNIVYNTDGLTTGDLSLGSVRYKDLVFPGANPPQYDFVADQTTGATDQSTTSRYVSNYNNPFTGINPVVPTAQQLPALNVQDALDALSTMATLPGVPPIENNPPVSVFGTLHSAYQGWTQVCRWPDSRSW